MSYSRVGGVQSTPLTMRGRPVARGQLVDVPLMQRGLADEEIEMPEVCARTGQPGACPAAPAPTAVVQPGSRLTVTTPSVTSAARAQTVPIAVAVGIGALAIYLLARS